MKPIHTNQTRVRQPFIAKRTDGKCSALFVRTPRAIQPEGRLHVQRENKTARQRENPTDERIGNLSRFGTQRRYIVVRMDQSGVLHLIGVGTA